MEKFVVRKADAPAENGSGGGGPQPQRLRQTRIGDGAKVVVAEVVQVLKAEIDAARTPDNMLRVLEALESQFISLEMLEQTMIGRSLERLYRRAQSDLVKEKAQRLLKIWKQRAKKAMRRRAKRVETYGRNFAD